ncbi:unnamed protein product [Haemonchus placei]|uniref:BAG domain-containing protein n=1 Tax=Haemonchus placei TaxID=6290 RepID=A0A0N4X6R8_HAEPC|nr:unnamed protein product [Haemonchus placei]
MAANEENMENPVVQKEDENNVARVSSEQNVFPVGKVSEELDRVIIGIMRLPIEVEDELTDARIAEKYRNQLRKVLKNQVDWASERLERLKASAVGLKLCGHGNFQTLYDKGIESAQ